MKKSFMMQDLDCANCAAKMETAINKIDGVESATVSFISQKLILEAEESDMEDIMQKVLKVCRKIEPDCRVII